LPICSPPLADRDCTLLTAIGLVTSLNMASLYKTATVQLDLGAKYMYNRLQAF